MRRHLIAAAILGLATSPALAEGPINLRGMGSFHVGGRSVEITGKPVREVLLGAGGVPAKLDPNGLYAVEHMYVQFFLPQTRKGKVPLEAYYSRQPGWAEQDPEYYWSSLAEACRLLWESVDIDRSLIRGVSVTTQRGTVINVDEQGQPLRPAIRMAGRASVGPSASHS